jgi:orotate phosphoribosyltransferase
VITAGTAVREACDIIRSRGAAVAGLAISLDRQERGQGTLSAVQELKSSLGISVINIIGLDARSSNIDADTGSTPECV